jgi:hypothetical protein
MASFEAAPALPALKAEQAAMNAGVKQKSSRVEEHGEDPFALTENCDYYPPSKVSADFFLHVVGTRLRYRTPRDVPPRSSVRSCPNFSPRPSAFQTHPQ